MTLCTHDEGNGSSARSHRFNFGIEIYSPLVLITCSDLLIQFKNIRCATTPFASRWWTTGSLWRTGMSCDHSPQELFCSGIVSQCWSGDILRGYVGKWKQLSVLSWVFLFLCCFDFFPAIARLRWDTNWPSWMCNYLSALGILLPIRDEFSLTFFSPAWISATQPTWILR
jgi:hypothetical protein